MGDTVIDGIIHGISKAWKEIIVTIIFVLAYKFGFIKDVLGLIGVVYLGYWAFKIWVHYVQQDFISGIEFIVLEVIPPREVLRSPKAMELFITNALYHYSNKGGRQE